MLEQHSTGSVPRCSHPCLGRAGSAHPFPRSARARTLCSRLWFPVHTRHACLAGAPAAHLVGMLLVSGGPAAGAGIAFQALGREAIELRTANKLERAVVRDADGRLRSASCSVLLRPLRCLAQLSAGADALLRTVTPPCCVKLLVLTSGNTTPGEPRRGDAMSRKSLGGIGRCARPGSHCWAIDF